MCFLPTRTPLQFFSNGTGGEIQESGNEAADNSDSSSVMSASVKVETGSMFRCDTQATVNLHHYILSQTF